MEYSDNAIASAENFAKMAKEYNSRLQKERLSSFNQEIENFSVREIIRDINSLIWLYNYIKKNIRTNKLKTFFTDFEEECLADLTFLKQLLNIDSGSKYNKNLKNFTDSLKLAISIEADLIKGLSRLPKTNILTDLIEKHLDFIKKLSSL